VWTNEITHSNLQERFDAEYYNPKYLKLIKNLDKLRDLRTLDDVARVFDGPFGSQLHCSDYVQEGIPFLRVQNVKENEINLNNLVFISKEDHERLKRSALVPGNVVMTKTGWLGIAAVIPRSLEECNIRADLAGIVIKQEYKKTINPYYLASYLNSKFGRFQSKRFNTGSTRPRILINYVKKIRIPLLPKERQDRIAYLSFRTKSKIKNMVKKSKDLLGSLSEILLKELKLNSLTTDGRKFYLVNYSELKKRFDPLYYHPKYSELLAELRKTPYGTKRLDEISNTILSGSYIDEYTEKGTLYLRVKNIKEGKLDLNDTKFVNIQKSEVPEKIRVQLSDILLTRTGTIGASMVAPKDIVGSVISQHLTRIVIDKDDMNPYYVEAFLNCKLARLQMERGCTGSMQKELVHKTLKSLIIPKPPKEVQDRIAEMVKKIRKEATQLMLKAHVLAKNTNEIVEELIEEN